MGRRYLRVRSRQPLQWKLHRDEVRGPARLRCLWLPEQRRLRLQQLQPGRHPGVQRRLLPVGSVFWSCGLRSPERSAATRRFALELRFFQG
jgi:hypothetical protein